MSSKFGLAQQTADPYDGNRGFSERDILMFRRFRPIASALFLSGLVAGTLLGLLVSHLTTTNSSIQFPDTVLNATASHGNDSFALATGPVGNSAEGLFVLDYVTGELRCFVVYPKTQVIGGQFKVNVAQVLGVEQGKKPKYLMVTGTASFPRGVGNVRAANCIVYVADANTGNFAAYGIPWNSNMENRNTPQGGPLTLIAGGKARNVEIRD